MVVWESVPTSVSGKATVSPSTDLVATTLARYSRLTWWTMPVPGGTTRKFWNDVLRPAQEHVALAVALVLEVDVLAEGHHRAEAIDLNRVVDDQVDRHERIDPADIATHPGNGRAHRRQIDHTGHAGEVLEDDPAGQVGQLEVGQILRIPVGECLDVVHGGELRADMAEQVLEHDADDKGQPVDFGHARALQCRQVRDGIRLTAGVDGSAHAERIACLIGRRTCHDELSSSGSEGWEEAAPTARRLCL